MQKSALNFQPISKALYLLELTRGTKEQLEKMQKAKNRPHVLDDEMIDRSICLYTAQNENNVIILQQCNIWKKETLT